MLRQVVESVAATAAQAEYADRRHRLAQLLEHYCRTVFKKLKAAAQAVGAPPKPMVK